jgi:GH25 family lysozyme M1 (1,4-beta-N-acetylmuramidase)
MNGTWPDGRRSAIVIKGVDVASYQSSDYSTKGLDFVFIKITARDAELVTGFYHFGRAGSMKAQADYFMSKINLVRGDMLVLDWEDTAVTNAEKDSWIKYVQKKRPNTRVLLYCNTNFWFNHDTTSFAGDGLWIANYNGKPGHPGIKHSWRFHQYTNDPIDTNVGQFDSRSKLRTWTHK